MKKKINFFLIFICYCSLCAAQQVVSTGGYSVKSEFSVNWILGGSLLDITPYDPGLQNKLNEKQFTGSMISVKIYPTPATESVKIEITPVDTGRLIFELFNNSGVKILSKTTAFQPVLQLDVSNIPSGIYLLKVLFPFKDPQLFKVEKIIKN